MTYNVFGVTLNLALSIVYSEHCFFTYRQTCNEGYCFCRLRQVFVNVSPTKNTRVDASHVGAVE